MPRLVEEIALESRMPLNQDDDDSNKSELHHRSDNIQNQNGKFNSKKHLKQFIIWIVLFICLFLIAGPLALHISYSVPTVKTRNSAGHIFSEERAHDYLNNLTQYGSRVSNTRANFDARDYLISQIKRIHSMNKRQLRYEVDLQNFTDSSHNQLQNILVRVSNPFTKSENMSSLMLSAHYDSVEFSPGGCDDGSGVVILLELFSNLVNDLTVTFSDVDLIILFTNGEESGLEGAKAFITNHTWRFNIHRFINVDSAGCNEVAGLLQLKPSQLVIDYSRVSRPRANVILENFSKWLGTSDYLIYSFNGSLLGYDFGFLLDGYTYHTPLDHPSIIKQGVIQDLGDNLGILIRNILLGYVEEIKNINDTDPLIYFDILGRYLIVYKLSTSIIIQEILIISIIAVGLILIIFDDIWHRQRPLVCNGSRCIYFHFKFPFTIRIISIILYLISNLISVLAGLLCSMSFSCIMSKIRSASWFGNSTLAIFLFSLPCLIGFISIGYLFDIFHRFILRKFPKNSMEFNSKHLNKIDFDFERNLSILLVYGLLMIVSIRSDDRLFYIILVWSIFLCPIYLLLMIIEFIIHWKEKDWNLSKQRYYWLFLPLIISLFPLTHTIEILHRWNRILIPFLIQIFSLGWTLEGNLIISCTIAIPTIFFVLIFVPILQRTKQFGRTLIILLFIFFIVFTIAFTRQPFTKNHPNAFYAKHTSKSTFKVEKLSNGSFIVSLVSQSSSIAVTTFDGLVLSSVLDEFSTKSGHVLHNKQCFNSTSCTFDDTFNRTIAVQQVEIESMKNFVNYTIVIRHVLSYNIQVSSWLFINFVIRNELNIPRRETIIDVILDSRLFIFEIDINIRRCEISDSPFLLLFTRLMPNIVLMGNGQCEAIEDNVTLIFDQKKLSKLK